MATRRSSRAKKATRSTKAAAKPADRSAPASAAAPSSFPPIAEYAFLSDCHTGALVAPDGSIDWLCVPRFDSPEHLRRPARPRGGLVPLRSVRHQRAVSARAYEPGTNVMVTTWKTPSGWVVVRDALVMGPTRGTGHGHAAHPTAGRRRRRARAGADRRVHRRPGRDRDRVRADLRLRAGPGDLEPRRRRRVTSPTPLAATRRCGSRPTSSSASKAAGAGSPRARGGRADLLRDLVGRRPRRTRRRRRGRAPAGRRHGRRTGAAGWAGRGSRTIATGTPIQRSALAIKGLTYMPTGATVAALTTGLPETPGGERNWDYRYCWMRDSTFTLQALHWLNLDWEANEFMQFVADLEANADGGMQIMYGIDGRRELTESTLDHLRGYNGARPVRIGNGAYDQRQNDVFGAVLDAVLPAFAPQPATAPSDVADRAGAGRVRDPRLARPGPGHLGGARQAAALRVVEAHVLGRARPRRTPGRHAGRRRPPGAVAGDGGRDPRRHPRARREQAEACCASTTTTDALDASTLLAPCCSGSSRTATSGPTAASSPSPTS